MKALITCNGEIKDYKYYKEYLINYNYDLSICADGGIHHMVQLEIQPDILLGDFDSIKQEELVCCKNSGVEIISYNKEKDKTDTEIAVEIAIDRGAKSILIIGALGMRIDHSLANIFLLKQMLDKGVYGEIIDENNKIILIKNEVIIKREENYKLTLLPFTQQVSGITSRGLYYELNNVSIKIGSSIGISNEFVSDIVQINVREGILLAIKSRDSQ